jgi:PAS domain S-box-containing protein
MDAESGARDRRKTAKTYFPTRATPARRVPARQTSSRHAAKERAAIAEMGRILGSSLDLREVYPRFAERIASLIACDRIAVTLVDREGGCFTTPYEAGVSVPGRQPGERVPLSGSLTAAVMASGKGLAIQGRSRQRVAADFPGLLPEFDAGLRSFLTAPLVARDEVIGAINLRARRARAFTAHRLQLVETLAHHVAAAIANASLYAEQQAAQAALRESEERYRLLVNNAEFPVVVTALSGGRVLFVNEQAAGFFGVSAAEVGARQALDFWVDPEDRDRFVAALSRDHRVLDYECRLKTKGEETRFALVSANIVEYAGERAAFAVCKDITERKSAEEAILAYQRRLEALLRGSLELSRIQPLESLLGRVGEVCARLLDADGGDFRAVEGEELARVAAWGDYAELGSVLRLKIGEGLSGMMAARGEPLVVDDPGGQPYVLPRTREAFRRLGHRTWLGVPALRGGRLLATLNMWTRRPHGFSSQDVAIAQAFSAQAATAIENARLYEAAQLTAEALGESEENLRITLQSIGDGVIATDRGVRHADESDGGEVDRLGGGRRRRPASGRGLPDRERQDPPAAGEPGGEGARNRGPDRPG